MIKEILIVSAEAQLKNLEKSGNRSSASLHLTATPCSWRRLLSSREILKTPCSEFLPVTSGFWRESSLGRARKWKQSHLCTPPIHRVPKILLLTGWVRPGTSFRPFCWCFGPLQAPLRTWEVPWCCEQALIFNTPWRMLTIQFKKFSQIQRVHLCNSISHQWHKIKKVSLCSEGIFF